MRVFVPSSSDSVCGSGCFGAGACFLICASFAFFYYFRSFLRRAFWSSFIAAFATFFVLLQRDSHWLLRYRLSPMPGLPFRSIVAFHSRVAHR